MDTHLGEKRTQVIDPDSKSMVSAYSAHVSGACSAAAPLAETLSPSPCRLKSRLKNGCWVCRQMRVKYDETQPECGVCRRLNKNCEWRWDWRFDDCNNRVLRKNRHVSRVGSSSWESGIRRPDEDYFSSPAPQVVLPDFYLLKTDDEREEKVSTRAPRTHSVVLIPDSFLCCYEGSETGQEDLTPPRHGVAGWVQQRELIVTLGSSDTTTSPVLPEQLLLASNLMPSTIYTAYIFNGSPHSGFRYEQYCTTYYGNSILQKAIPLMSSSMFDTGDEGEQILIASESYPPLRYAFCALVLLSAALRETEKPYLKRRAFQYYQQAIAACRSCTNVSVDFLLYLHFTLLVFDLCCDDQGSQTNGVMRTQHFDRIGRLANCPELSHPRGIHAHIFWYTLRLDAQSCFAGDPRAGAFIRASPFLCSGTSLSPSSQKTSHYSSSKDDILVSAVTIYATHVWTCQARLSLLALELRHSDERAHGGSPELAERVNCTRNELLSSWYENYPQPLPRDLKAARRKVPSTASMVFDSASIQFFTTMLYLFTSMYRDQHKHITLVRSKEIVNCCENILDTADVLVNAENFSEQQYLVFPVFLAGVCSMRSDDRLRAIKITRRIQDAGIGVNGRRACEMLEAIHKEQEDIIRTRGGVARLDWISFAKERNMALFNFGL